MATIKSFTDISQSKVLAEILPLESADMCYMYLGTEDKEYEDIPICAPAMEGDLCAWSLAALLAVLPEGIIEKYYSPNLQKENGKYSIAYGDDELLCIEDNPVDACVAMIELLHEQKLL